MSIAATDADASEASDDGQFTVSMSAASSTDTLVSYAISGTADNGDDFQTLSGTVVIAAGE